MIASIDARESNVDGDAGEARHEVDRTSDLATPSIRPASDSISIIAFSAMPSSCTSIGFM
jgi:hypothetical protein